MGSIELIVFKQPATKNRFKKIKLQVLPFFSGIYLVLIKSLFSMPIFVQSARLLPSELDAKASPS